MKEYWKSLGYKYKVIIDWTGTEVRDDEGERIDKYRFKTKEVAWAFCDGFLAGNGYVSEPQLKVKEIE